MSINALIQILNAHIEKYDGFSARDAYKLFYQCHMGPGHAVNDIASTKKYLLDELAEITPDDSISLVETISPENKVVRINLAPFKSRGFNPDRLFDVFTNSATACEMNIDSFIKDWNELIELTINAQINLPHDEMHELNKIVVEKEYPPVHHSPEYSQKNKPAYRVVLRDIFIKSFPDL